MGEKENENRKENDEEADHSKKDDKGTTYVRPKNRDDKKKSRKHISRENDAVRNGDLERAKARVTEGANLDTLIQKLPGCSSRDLIDQLTVEFCYLNSKANRKKLAWALFNVPRTSLELLPYYSRLVATLSTYMKDLPSITLSMLEDEFNFLINKKVFEVHKEAALHGLDKSSAHYVLHQLQKLPWSECEPYLLKCFLKVLEEIRVGLELNDYSMQQQRLAHMQFFGELYNYEHIGSSIIFQTLYLIIVFGHRTPEPLGCKFNISGEELDLFAHLGSNMTRYSSMEELSVALIELEANGYVASAEKCGNEWHSGSKEQTKQSDYVSFDANHKSSRDRIDENGNDNEELAVRAIQMEASIRMDMKTLIFQAKGDPMEDLRRMTMAMITCLLVLMKKKLFMLKKRMSKDLRATELENGGENASVSINDGDGGKVCIKVLVKKGHKQQIKEMFIPGDCLLVQSTKQQEAAELEEKQSIKN
uniref:MIF4G domain-containing protein n=1 Tax=Oryza barthii TaxID=65489 RepID=A0A0D3FY30_9ORYZ